MELVEFLLARVAEDEAVAQAATPGAWEFVETSDGWDGKTLALETVAKLPPYSDGSVGAVAGVLSGWGYDASGISVSDEDAAHIARWHPPRILAECEAKRRIVEDHVVYAQDMADAPSDFAAGRLFMARLAVVRLAEVYADHPDYDPEWKA